MVVAIGHAEDQVGERLGQAVGVMRALDVDHLRDAVEGGGFGGGIGAIMAGDEHVDVAAHRLRRGDGLCGGVVQMRIVVLGKDQDSHVRSLPLRS